MATRRKVVDTPKDGSDGITAFTIAEHSLRRLVATHLTNASRLQKLVAKGEEAAAKTVLTDLMAIVDAIFHERQEIYSEELWARFAMRLGDEAIDILVSRIQAKKGRKHLDSHRAIARRRQQDFDEAFRERWFELTTLGKKGAT